LAAECQRIYELDHLVIASHNLGSSSHVEQNTGQKVTWSLCHPPLLPFAATNCSDLMTKSCLELYIQGLAPEKLGADNAHQLD